jgi:hypothetical protein
MPARLRAVGANGMTPRISLFKVIDEVTTDLEFVWS